MKIQNIRNEDGSIKGFKISSSSLEYPIVKRALLKTLVEEGMSHTEAELMIYEAERERDAITYCDINECKDCPRYGDDCDGREDE